MEEHHWYFILIIAILVPGIIWGAVYKKTAPPSEMLANAAAQIKEQCMYACGGENRTLSFEVPAGTTIYTTREAICLRRNSALFCSTCICDVQETRFVFPAQQNISCTMSGPPVTLTC